MGRPASSRIDLTTGSTFRNLVLFSAPIMLQGSFQILYNLVDRWWVGGLGKEALAAVSVGFPVIFFMISLFIGIAIGAGIMIAQYKGADERELVNLTTRNFIVFGTIVVLTVSAVMFALSDHILRMLDTPEDIIYSASVYLRWIFGGLIFMFGYNAATGIFRGLGDSATPTKIAAFTTVLNIVLDPIFIFGIGPVPRLEVAGAAFATVLSNLVGAVIIMYYLARQTDYIDLRFRGFKFDWKIIRDILRLGVPTSAGMVLVSLSSMVMMYFVNGFGTAAVAGYGIGFVLDSLMMMPAQSFAMTMSTVAGQNVGAGKLDRIGKYLRETIMLAVGIAILVSVVLVLTTSWVTAKFQPNPDDYKVVLPYVTIYVRIMVIRYVMMSIFFPLNGTVRGAGDAMAAMVLSMFTQLIIRIPAAYILTRYFDFAGVPWALSMSTIFGAIIMYIYYRTGIWVRRGALVNISGLGPGVPTDSPQE
jgi:putative MATE family efflux protein